MKISGKLLAQASCMLCLFFAFHGKAQPWFGQIKYPHDSTILSSAKRTFQNPGYVMAGFRPVRNAAAQPDFVIDKVDADGFFTSASAFSNIYQIMANPASCSSSAFVYQCEGVTVIETKNQGNNEMYALAGCYSGGIFFATLDPSGNIINRNFWPFPFAVGGNKKPMIRESVTGPGRYYISGENGGLGYVIKVDFLGNQIWANTYTTGWNIEPRDLIESPYSTNELIVVGRTDVPNSPTAADAFYMSLDSGTGNVNFFNYYNFLSWDSDDWFSCIEPASSPTGGAGYVLGGRAFGPTGPFPSSFNARYTQWMCKLDMNGNVVWSTLIKPRAFVYNTREGDEINRVYERFNANGTYEYYGVAGSYYSLQNGSVNTVNNLVVFKLDDNGQKTLIPNEFHYLGGGWAPTAPSAGSPYAFSDLTAIETAGGANDGLQAFGTDLNPNGESHYFCKAYFNGVSGCKDEQLRIDSLFTGPLLWGQYPITVNPITACGSPGINFIVNNVNPSYNTLCYASSVPNGSNARHALGIASLGSDNDQITVFPNPVKDKATVSVSASANDPVSLVILNNLGQKVGEFNYVNTAEGKYVIDLSTLGIKSGLYFIQLSTPGIKTNYKLIYEPQ